MTLTGSLLTVRPFFEMVRAAASAACLEVKLIKLTLEVGTTVADFIESAEPPNADLS